MAIDFKHHPMLRVLQEIVHKLYKYLGRPASRLACAAGLFSDGWHHNPVCQEAIHLMQVIIRDKNEGEHLRDIRSSLKRCSADLWLIDYSSA